MVLRDKLHKKWHSVRVPLRKIRTKFHLSLFYLLVYDALVSLEAIKYS